VSGLRSARINGFVEGVADERPPLVFLHGLTFDDRMWLPAIAALRRSEPGRLILVLDLPGHGGSPMIPISVLDDVAAAVASAVDEAGLDRPVIVGHSISAVIATICASTYPTRGVVDVDQELDPSFIGTLQGNRDAMTGAGFAHV
jgi:pimeloyl-ACP methyl ester carboxylesterase